MKALPLEKPLRVMLLDIESTNLSADFGYILCIAWKWSGEKKVYSLNITQSPTFADDPTNDKWLVEQFAKEVEKADLLVFHYGMFFDFPYLQTRALYHGLRPLANIPFVDTWKIAKKRLKLHSNRLASISELLGVQEKTPLSGRIWVRAMAGHKPSIRYVLKHCIQDVVVLEEVYDRIKGLGWDRPALSHVGCPTCGSHDVQQRGRVKTLKTIKQRYSCNSCGHWFAR